MTVKNVDVTPTGIYKSGQTLNLSWEINNEGSKPTTQDWIERIYLSKDGTIEQAILLKTIENLKTLVAGESYPNSTEIIIPDIEDGEYQIIVVTDADNQITETPTGETNNQETSRIIEIKHSDLSVTITNPINLATSGTTIPLTWLITNIGNAPTLTPWKDRLYLSTDTNLDLLDDLFIGEFDHSQTLETEESQPGSFNFDIPIELSGDYYLLVIADADNSISEGNKENNNLIASPIKIELAPYADLEVTNVKALKPVVIGDPASLDISWTVTNQGTGKGEVESWTDQVILSKDDQLGNNDDFILGEYIHRESIDLENPSRIVTETFLLPPSFNGRYHIFVKTDINDVVFEHDLPSDNITISQNPVDIVPLPYADLVISALEAEKNTANSGQALEVSWTVTNQGIGLTSTNQWSDRLQLASDPEGKQIVATLGAFDHVGNLAVEGSYERTATVILPHGLEGTYYVVAKTGGPYEFIYTDNNQEVSQAIAISLTPPPDLEVIDIIAPMEIQAGQKVDLTWQVRNLGDGQANGTWVDEVYLQAINDPNGKLISLGRFTYDQGLEAGKSYSRTEQFSVPARLEGLYQVVVKTNKNESLYEHGATDNNTTVDKEILQINLPLRPDLQVESLEAPLTVSAGGTISGKFTIINRGDVSTTTPNWEDRVYLSLDDQLSSDDILLGSFTNGSALASGDRYPTIFENAIIPRYFRGSAFLIVHTDAHRQVDEYPQEANNTKPFEIQIESLPPADLVTSDVVAPDQAFDGSTIKVTYTITNKGIGETDHDSWSETIWLTKDKNRPSPINQMGESEDILLKTFTHNGSLAVDKSIKKEIEVTLPKNITGEWYITPWSDAYDIVLEDTFDVNINPDDPNELNSNNYKARPITILLTPPADLVVTEIETTPVAQAGEPFKVTWTVENQGNTAATDTWTDSVYLSDQPTLNAPNARQWFLGEVERNGNLEVDQSYTQSLEVILSPAAEGKYVIVKTNADKQAWEGPYADNNESFTATDVTNNPADLVVTSLETIGQGISGEKLIVQWTVENQGAPMWSGTKYWYDEIWVSKDPTFIPGRATKVGSVLHSPEKTLGRGDSYNETYDITLPAGIEGDYYLYLSTNYSYERDSPYRGTDFVNGGSNEGSRESFVYRGFEDSSNNLESYAFPVIYREPDLEGKELEVVKGLLQSGETIRVGWTVTNIGSRATRQYRWIDQVYLSEDASLDSSDRLLGSWEQEGFLEIGQSYKPGGYITLPEGIEGDFYLLAFTDANLKSTKNSGVPEFQDEGNNITSVSLPITLREPPDLQVTQVKIPERATIGQSFKLTYQVTNKGDGDTPTSQSQWDDLIYLSKDEFLDLNADTYLGSVTHYGGLASKDSYVIPEKNFDIPTNLSGSFYVFVVTDPRSSTTKGQVFEGAFDNNNAFSSLQPLILELPPPADLVVDSIKLPSSSRSGEEVTLQWTVLNQGDNPASGRWSDAVYLSEDNEWDIGDRLLGRVQFNGEVTPGQTYNQTLNTTLPPVLPGSYRIIVRPDIYNQIYEAENEVNNQTTSLDPFDVKVEELFVGVPLETTLNTGQSRLYQIQLEPGQTLKVTVDSANDESANELFVRYGQVPTQTNYDGFGGELAADQSVIIPTSEPGTYYVLVKGFSQPTTNTATRILAELLPFSITNVQTDRGGDSRYVTTNISGAQFHPNALVKLVRPGIAEYEPVNYQVIDSTEITAIFDLREAPHGLYDVKVINPDGSEAIVPYRYLVERAIEPDVTVGLGGKNVLTPGENGTYGFSVKSLTNIDTPYVHFQFGIPELGENGFLFGKFDSEIAKQVGVEELPYVTFSSNLRGQPDTALGNLPWASLISDVNTDGEILAPGYIFDLPTGDWVGRTFNVQTYAGFLELLKLQPDALEDLLPSEHGQIAFKFHIQASATALTRDEFIQQQTQEALRLREAVLQDPTAATSLIVLAADEDLWVTSYLAALEEAELLRPEEEAPPIRQNPLVVSLMSALGTGILIGPAGEQIISNGNLIKFFEQIRTWYGHDADLISNSPFPTLADYDLNLTQRTHFESFNIYVPFGTARVDLPLGTTVSAPDFARFFDQSAISGQLASITGPIGAGEAGFVPLDEPLPYTIQFENASTANATAGEVRIVTQLDSDLDPRSFRLGDLQLGDLQVHIPGDRATFSGDFDFSSSKGFILRVSAGLDPLSNTATWLLQAIDPKTGEVITDRDLGLLPPNDVTGAGKGFVTYTVQPKADVLTGTEISSTARILLNTAPPVDTTPIHHFVDAVAPTTHLTAQPLTQGGSDYLVEWDAVDDETGSGVQHVTVYVAEDGGDFKIWLRQTNESSAVFLGEAGHSYEFLAIATDNAGNQELSAVVVPDDGSSANLGNLPTVGQTSEPDVKSAPNPSTNVSTNRLFLEAKAEIPSHSSNSRPSEFTSVLRPFVAQGFVTDVPGSHADISAMAIVELEDGSILFSGGTNRGSLFQVEKTGGTAATPLIELSLPVFDLALADNGSLWATTGGGPLLQLDRATGEIIAEYGDGITQSLAIDGDTGLIYLSSGNGIEIFNPVSETFTHFSHLRVGNLTFAPDGSLWATRWPERGEVVRFDENNEPQLMLEFDLPIDSLAFGQAGTQLEGLLFISSNSGEVLMVDLATREHLIVADGGSRGDIIETTADGRVLLSQSNQIDVFSPVLAPQVVYTNPSPDALVALPNNTLAVTFDQDIYVEDINTDNFRLVGANSAVIAPTSVRYEAASLTAYLEFEAIAADDYQLQVSDAIHSEAGLALESVYTVDFTAISDFSPYVDLQFTNTRSDRATQTVSFDITLTNQTNYDLLLPLAVLLQPETGNTAVPVEGTTANFGSYLVDLSDSLPDGRLKSGQSLYEQTITIYNPDALSFEFAPAIYTLPTTNEAPVITSTTLTPAIAGQGYSYQIAAHDPDGSILGYLLYDAPEGMVINSQTGLIQWNPTADSSAENEVILHVYDSRGGRSSQQFNLSVTGGNEKPIFAPLPTEINGYEGQTLNIALTATDDDPLQYWVNNLPNGATFSNGATFYPDTQVLSWTPGFEAAGIYEDVTFVVSDGVHRVSQTTTFIIAPTNQAPTLLTFADKTVVEGDRLRLQLVASDPEGDSLTYFSNLLPGGSRLDPNTGVFEWTPGYFQAGDYTIPFSVSDGETVTTQTVRFEVLNVNAAPVFDSLDSWSVVEEQSLRFRAFAFDPDNPSFVPQERLPNGELTILEGSEPTVTYTVSGLPTGATFDVETGIFSWTPDYDKAGIYQVTFTATDDGNGLSPQSSTITVPIRVGNVNRQPEFTPIGNQTVQRGEVLDIPITVTDPDGDAITLTATGSGGFGLPSFASFIDKGDGTAFLRLTPGSGDRGNYTLTLIATDGEQSTGEYTFVVSVEAFNDAPQLEWISDKVAVVGEPLTFTVRVNDLDEDGLNFEVMGLSPGATLTPSNIYGRAIFNWTPTSVGNYPITITVKDSGNGDASLVETAQQSFNLVVRHSNTAPSFASLADLSVNEGETLSVFLNAIDAEGDVLTYSATNLPAGATLNPQTGELRWTPTYLSAGTYDNILVTVSDGHKSSSQTFSITVNNSNRPPVLTPIAPQLAREGTSLQFTLNAYDIDNDSILYALTSALPTGATFNHRTGAFHWLPNYDQAGNYTLEFTATDVYGATDVQEVAITVDNLNRLPSLQVSPQIVALGERLEFALIASDPDTNTVLSFSADHLPDGAVLDAETGIVTFQPSPGQVGDYLVRFAVTDGEATVEKHQLIRVETTPSLPTVVIDTTPSFPPLPGQRVTLSAIADSFTDITNLQVTVDGQALELDQFGRAYFIPETPGHFTVEATATDLADRVGTQTQILKVRDAADTVAPMVKFFPGLDGEILGQLTPIVATIADSNLDQWVLSVSDKGENQWREIASGQGTVNQGIIAEFDPNEFSNGFYEFQLAATDIKGRQSKTSIVVEVNSNVKTAQYQRSETDLTVNLGGTSFDLVRRYDSLQVDELGRFGSGWHLANREFDLQTDAEEGTPFQAGTRLYLTLPDGERVGFTFAPQQQALTGLTYYTPAWIGDAGVDYTLTSGDGLLSKAGTRFYDLQSAKPYHPTSDQAYRLMASDGTIYYLDGSGQVTEQIMPSGIRLFFSDTGITSSTGEVIRFVNNEQGYLAQITAPDGTAVVYGYDEAGHLISARNLAVGASTRYGYGTNGLNLVAGDAGEMINYDNIRDVLPLKGDLGSAIQFTGTSVTGNLTAGETDFYSFTVRSSELGSTDTGLILLGVEVTGVDELPEIQGLTPVSTQTTVDGMYGLFAVEQAGLHQLSVNGDGNYGLQLSVVGDFNLDGKVDGVDSQLLLGQLGGQYDLTFDLNRDGVIDGVDVQILGSNYGFSANLAPVVTGTEVLTHEDLRVLISLGDLASDPEGDLIFYRAANVVGGTISFLPDGQTAKFMPTVGFTGTASFDLLADDGFSVSVPATVTVNVSDAPLTSLDFVERNPKLQVGGHASRVREQRFQLVAIADFADQEDVILPGDYLTWGSESPTVATISETGWITGVNDGTTILSATRNGIEAVTVSRVGKIPAPTNDAEFYLALAEEQGLDIYPDAVTLTKGIERQILVGINSKLENPNLLSDADTGTRYFVSNPNILTVSEDGLITTLTEGFANVTVIHGGTEAILPVNVEVPHVGATTLGTDGGVVQGSDGSLVMIPDGALNEEATVNIAPLTLDDLSIPISDDFEFVGAFELVLGGQELAFPAQLAIPAPEGLALGTEVFFIREAQIPDETGALTSIKVIEESGIVGADGNIRTASPPWGGAKVEGKYSIEVPTFDYNEVLFNMGTVATYAGLTAFVAITVVSGAATTTFFPLYFTALKNLSLGTALLSTGGAGILTGAGLLSRHLAQQQKVDITVITIPKVGLPLKNTVTGVELNLNVEDGKTIPVFDIPLPFNLGTSNLNAPQVNNVSVNFDSDGQPLIKVSGANFGETAEELKVEFSFGQQVYESTQITLDESKQELTVYIPNYLPLGQKSFFEILRGEQRSGKISLGVKQDLERSVIVDRLLDQLYFVETLDPEQVVAQSDQGSANLLLGKIPVGNKDVKDFPRYLAATNDGSRIYVPLEESSSVAVVDGIGMRQLDENSETPEVDNIKINNATPSSIVISPDDQFAYIGDLEAGTIYFINIDPESENYHIPNTLNFEHGKNIEVASIRRLAINSDGTLLFATTGNPQKPSKPGKQILVFDIAPRSSGQPRHRLIDVIELEIDGLEGIAPTPDPNKMIFTNRLRDSKGFGYLEIVNYSEIVNKDKISQKLQVVWEYAQLNLGSTRDYFDVNEAVAVTMMRTEDGEEYAFVAGRNSDFSQFGQGIASIDSDPRAGSSIGIIKDPLNNPQLIAATKPVPNGYLSGLTLSSDNKYLTASYTLINSTFVYDVEEILKTIDEYKNSFNPFKNLSKTPLEEFNEKIRIVGETEVDENGQLPKNSPVSTPGGGASTSQSKRGLIKEVEVEFKPSNETEKKKNVIVTWKGKDGIELVTPPPPETQPEPEDEEQKKATDLPVIEFYVSTFPEKEGLFPNDWIPDVASSENQKKDYNPNRVLSANFSFEQFTKSEGWTGRWYILEQKDGVITSIPTAQTDPQEFTQPEDLKLTAGQTYHWGFQVRGLITSSLKSAAGQSPEIDRETGTFTVPLGKLDNQPTGSFSSVTVPLDNLENQSEQSFSSVTVLTRGIEQTGFANKPNQQRLNAIAAHIEKQGGSVMKYDHNNGWQLVKSFLSPDEQIDWRFIDGSPQLGQPLVLLTDWIVSNPITSDTSAIHNAGFAEAAADTIFTSLVELDDTQIGNNGNPYDSERNLERTLGSIFNSPLHFIGFGQGAVVNSEIIQRIGTFFPKDQYDIPDIQMTTIDPFNYSPSNSSGTFANIQDPKITAWDNVTYVDNYTGRKVSDLNFQTDWNLNFFELSDNQSKPYVGFEEVLSENDRHQNTLIWYTGTADLSYNPEILDPDTKVYRRLGDLYPDKDPTDNQTYTDLELHRNWYTPDHTAADFDYGDEQAQWEGIGTGWFHSVLGGGYELRPYLLEDDELNVYKLSKDEIRQFGYESGFPNAFKEYLESNRTPITTDNTASPLFRGDFAVPTLFNGNFDAITYKNTTQTIPGWSLYNGIENEDVSQEYLEKGIAGNNSFALKLGGGVNSITHNPFVVPDWGELNFDLFTDNAQGGNLKIEIKGVNDDSQWRELTTPWGYRPGSYYYDQYIPTQQLAGVELREGNYSYSFDQYGLPNADNEYNYNLIQSRNDSRSNLLGSATQSFETFTFGGEALEELRGKPALLKFTLEGNTQIALDNIFFSNPHLQLGNPTEARNDLTYSDNYLIEKPQYSLSFNRTKKTLNWVSWELDSSWYAPPFKNGLQRPVINVREDHPDFPNNTTNPFNPARPDDIKEDTYQALRDRFPFEVDYALPENWRNGDRGYRQDAFFNSGYDTGHLTASSDRNLHIKDQYATYSMSNMLPMASATNRINGAWQGLEDHLSNLARSGKKLHIVAGGHGSLGTTRRGGNTIPEKLWKVAVVLEPNQTIHDIDASNDVIAVILPNNGDLGKDRGRGWAKDGSVDGLGRVSINQIERLIGGNIDLLRNLPNNSVKLTLKSNVYDNPYLSSSLLAESEDSNQSLLSEIEIFDDISTWHNSVFVGSTPSEYKPSNSVSEIGISKFGTTGISPRNISPFEISCSEEDIINPGVAQISPLQIGFSEVGSIEFSPFQISSRQVNSSKIGFAGQTNIDEISLSPSVPFQQFFNGNSGSVEFSENSVSIEKIGIIGIDREFLDSLPNRHSTFVFDGVNNGTRHGISSLILNNLNNSATNIWSDLLQTQTSLDINFQITDLPTGQLAEATITGFDSFGRPNAGTILIDYNANGVGWLTG